MALTKVERNKRTRERLERENKYRVKYQKEKYKFINVQFRIDDEIDKYILDYLEGLDESRANFIKRVLYEKIKESNN